MKLNYVTILFILLIAFTIVDLKDDKKKEKKEEKKAAKKEEKYGGK
jgi:hypothetical protein